jgi:uncharacterized protein YjbJ (UPF0337 family)
MNWDQIEGNWKQVKGQIKAKWGKLTDDDLTTLSGKRDELAGVLQERYGYAKDKAERELDDFSRSLKP